MTPQTKRNLRMAALFVFFFSLAFFGTSMLLGKGKLERKLQGAADEINKNIPAMVDAETRLDSASVSGDTLRYHFTLPNESVDRKTFDPQSASAFVMEQAQKNYDTQSGMEELRQEGVVLHYFYKDQQGRHAFDFTIKPKQE